MRQAGSGAPRGFGGLLRASAAAATTRLAQAVLVAAALLATPFATALVDMPDEEMQAISGAGIALAFDDFQFAMAPTSYFEMVGSDPAVKCTATGAGVGNQNCWRRGDLRWFGLAMTGISGTG